jgi:hypothetical protein
MFALEAEVEERALLVSCNRLFSDRQEESRKLKQVQKKYSKSSLI